MRLTKTQREALVEAAGPVKTVRGTGFRVGGGYLVANNPRTLQSLIRAGLVEKASAFDRHGGWITDAGRAAIARIEKIVTGWMHEDCPGDEPDDHYADDPNVGDHGDR